MIEITAIAVMALVVALAMAVAFLIPEAATVIRFGSIDPSVSVDAGGPGE